MSKGRKIMEGVYPMPQTILLAIRATQTEIMEANGIEDRELQEVRLNFLRRIYMEQTNR